MGRGASGGTFSQSYGYDALDRVQTLTSSGPGGAGAFTYNYKGDTSILSRLDLPNNTKVEQSYDTLQRLSEVKNLTTGGANLASYAYAYDTRDVRTGVQSQFASEPLKQVAYSYDTVDQLTGEVATGGAANAAYSNAFQYDSMGNRTQGSFSHNGTSTLTTGTSNRLNQLSALSRSSNGLTSTTALLHDSAGNLTQQTASDGSKTLYLYDDADRLWRIERRDAAGGFVSKSEWVYDYASRKAIRREFTFAAGAWALQSETRRVFDGLDVVQERNGTNEVTAQLTRDGNIGGILARSTASGVSYFGYDGGGNVTLLTDEAGAEVGRYSYDAFGNTLEISGVRAGENPYRFSTKEYHAPSGLYDFGYRFYSASLGRWINRDPIEEDGGVNLYAFVGNGPVNGVDAYGLARVIVRGWELFNITVANNRGSGVWSARIVTFYHAYIIVAENDWSNPQIYHGWNGGRFPTVAYKSGSATGFQGRIQVRSGSYDSDWEEYTKKFSGPEKTIVNCDNKPASFYNKQFQTIADALHADKNVYHLLKQNSNTVIREILSRAGLDDKKPAFVVPGWNYAWEKEMKWRLKRLK